MIRRASAEVVQSEADGDAAVRSWIETNLGRVLTMERQARWLSGAARPHQEGQILSVFEQHDIPVPHVYGSIEHPEPGHRKTDTEVVGIHAHRAHMVGADAGELPGIEQTLGVMTRTDVDEIIELASDCVSDFRPPR